MDEIIGEVLKSISSENIEGDSALRGEEAVPISKENFHEIENTEKNFKVSFVDGGNTELFGAASFSLQLIRIGVITYDEKIEREKNEFYLLISFKDENFTVKTFPENKLPDLSFNSVDPMLTHGSERAKAFKIGSVCRRIAELSKAYELNSDFIVIDGDLFPRTQQEETLIEKLKEKPVIGVSKTSNLLTKQGRVFSAALNSLKQGSWYYYPVFKDAYIYFARFHPKSEYVFSVDMLNSDLDIISWLKKNSSDPVFLGYPYGLVEADRLARVGNKEKEFLRTKFRAKFGRDWDKVKTYLRTKDAHSVLDNVG